MKRVITVNLNGNAYQLDEDAYEILRVYFAQAESRLAGDPDRGEILGDLERSIADKCPRYLNERKSVLSHAEVQQIVEELGPVDARAGDWTADAQTHGDAAEDTAHHTGGDIGGDIGGEPVGARAGATDREVGGAAGSSAEAESPPRERSPKRLYQIREGAMISGVCNGLAAYFNMDVTIMRVIFIVLAILSSGIWALVYVALMFLVPYDTDVERMSDRGLHAQVFRFVTHTKRKFAAS